MRPKTLAGLAAIALELRSPLKASAAERRGDGNEEWRRAATRKAAATKLEGGNEEGGDEEGATRKAATRKAATRKATRKVATMKAATKAVIQLWSSNYRCTQELLAHSSSSILCIVRLKQ